MKTILTLAGVLLVGAGSGVVRADDWILSPSPVVQRTYYAGPGVVGAPVTTYYGPSYAPTVVTQPTVVSAPAPVTTYYAPGVTRAYYGQPVVAAPRPVTAYYAPSVVAPPVTTYYAPSAVPTVRYYAPAAVVAPAPTVAYYGATTGIPVTTYYAPAAPAIVAAPVYARPGLVTSKVYYPFQPVRNLAKAIAP